MIAQIDQDWFVIGFLAGFAASSLINLVAVLLILGVRARRRW